jgi:hypothetical protein
MGNSDPGPDPGARKLRHFSGNNYFLKKMNNTSIFDLI